MIGGKKEGGHQDVVALNDVLLAQAFTARFIPLAGHANHDTACFLQVCD